MKQLTKRVSSALALLYGLLIFNTSASGLDQSKLEMATKHLSSMSREQNQAVRQAIGQLSPEQKTQIKKTLKENYNDLSDEEKARLQSQLSGFAASHPQALKAAINKLSDADKQRIVQQILQQVEKKLSAMPSEQRNDLYEQLRQVTTPRQRLKILSAVIGRIGEVTYGVSGGEILATLNDMSLSELAILFSDLSTALSDSVYGDSILASTLSHFFDGLSELAEWAENKLEGDIIETYVPMFLRTPNAAKCRTAEGELLVSDSAIECEVTEKNVFWTPKTLTANHIVKTHSTFITLTCAEGWSPEGEYCTHASIPGAGVKAEIIFDGEVITSGGERYELVFKDHFNVESLSASERVGNGPHAIDDYGNKCALAAEECQKGNGMYHSQNGGFDGALKVNVTWSLLHPELYKAPNLSEVNAKSLYPFSVNYADSDSAGALALSLKDNGSPNNMIVTNMPGWRASCAVIQPEQTVDLGTILFAEINRGGVVESSLKPFEINLSCTGTETNYQPLIKLTTSAPTGMEVTPSGEVIGIILNEFTGSNATRNVGVMVYQDLPTGRFAIPGFNNATNYRQEFDLSGGVDPTLKFLAGFYKSSMLGDLTPGKFEATVTVELVFL